MQLPRFRSYVAPFDLRTEASRARPYEPHRHLESRKGREDRLRRLEFPPSAQKADVYMLMFMSTSVSKKAPGEVRTLTRMPRGVSKRLVAAGRDVAKRGRS